MAEMLAQVGGVGVDQRRTLRGYDGALVVVSHDAAFLDAIGIQRRIELRPAC
jgi:hypothetical protein